MNGFYIDAVGWILTVNVRALNRREARELSGLWSALTRARAQDLSEVDFLSRLLFPRSKPLSEKTTQALGMLLARMALLHPERFGEDALRRRRAYWLLQSVASFLLWGGALSFLPTSWPLVTEVVQTLFLMGLAFTVPGITLWRAARAAKYFAANDHRKLQHAQSSSTAAGEARYTQ